MIKNSILLIFLLLASCTGWIYVPVSDENLVIDSHTVIVGTVFEELSQDTFNLNGTYRFYKVNVSKVLSPIDQPLKEVIIRTLGGQESSSSYLHVPGSPTFTSGETVLLFIQPSGSFYVIDHFALGAFHQVEYSDGSSTSSYAYRISDDDLPNSQLRLRDFNQFSNWIESSQRMKRDASSQTYWKQLSENDWSNLQQHMSPLRTRYHQMLANGVPVRWTEFDSGSSVTWMSDPAGQPGLNGGGFAEFSQAFSAWNSVPGTKIKYVYGGTTTGSLGGLTTSDGKQGILWDTAARNEIPGSFSCATGGVLAIGGWRSRSQQTTFRGIKFYKITEADTTIQDGLSCWLSKSSTPSKDFANTLTHEFGHTLGMDHSCGDEDSGTCVSGSDADKAIMRAYTQIGGVGATLGVDDVLGAQYIYASCFPNCESTKPAPTPNTPASPTPSPATPTGLTVSPSVFVVRFDVALASFNKRQVNLGFCKLLNVDSSSCLDDYFANSNTWEGSTYYQFQLAGPLVTHVSTLQSLLKDSPDKVSSAVGYTVLNDNTGSAEDDSSSDSKILGLDRQTAIYVLAGGGVGVVLLIALCTGTITLARRRSTNRYRRSSSVNEQPVLPGYNEEAGMEEMTPVARPPIYAPSNQSSFVARDQGYSVGSACTAKFSGDGRFYKAKIIHRSGDQFLVSFMDFDDQYKDEWVLMPNIRPM